MVQKLILPWAIFSCCWKNKKKKCYSHCQFYNHTFFSVSHTFAFLFYIFFILSHITLCGLPLFLFHVLSVKGLNQHKNQSYILISNPIFADELDEEYDVKMTIYEINDDKCSKYNLQSTMWYTIYNKECTIIIYNKEYTIYNIQQGIYNKEYTIYNIQQGIYNIYNIQQEKYKILYNTGDAAHPGFRTSCQITPEHHFKRSSQAVFLP